MVDLQGTKVTFDNIGIVPILPQLYSSALMKSWHPALPMLKTVSTVINIGSNNYESCFLMFKIAPTPPHWLSPSVRLRNAGAVMLYRVATRQSS